MSLGSMMWLFLLRPMHHLDPTVSYTCHLVAWCGFFCANQ